MTDELELTMDNLNPGDYVIAHWTESDTYQSAAGFFDHKGWWHIGDGHVWLVFDWGFAVDTMSDNFRLERGDAPEGETYIPIDLS